MPGTQEEAAERVDVAPKAAINRRTRDIGQLFGRQITICRPAVELEKCSQYLSRFSSAVEQRFCKPKVGSSILSTGTSENNVLAGFSLFQICAGGTTGAQAVRNLENACGARPVAPLLLGEPRRRRTGESLMRSGLAAARWASQRPFCTLRGDTIILIFVRFAPLHQFS